MKTARKPKKFTRHIPRNHDVVWDGAKLAQAMGLMISHTDQTLALANATPDEEIVARNFAEVGFWTPIAAVFGDDKVVELTRYLDAFAAADDWQPEDMSLAIPAGIMGNHQIFTTLFVGMALQAREMTPVIPSLHEDPLISLTLNLVRNEKMLQVAGASVISGLRAFWSALNASRFPDAPEYLLRAMDEATYDGMTALYDAMFLLPALTNALANGK